MQMMKRGHVVHCTGIHRIKGALWNIQLDLSVVVSGGRYASIPFNLLDHNHLVHSVYRQLNHHERYQRQREVYLEGCGIQ